MSSSDHTASRHVKCNQICFGKEQHTCNGRTGYWSTDQFLQFIRDYQSNNHAFVTAWETYCLLTLSKKIGSEATAFAVGTFDFLCARSHSMVNRTWIKQNIYRKRCMPKPPSVGKESLMAYVATKEDKKVCKYDFLQGQSLNEYTEISDDISNKSEKSSPLRLLSHVIAWWRCKLLGFTFKRKACMSGSTFLPTLFDKGHFV